MSERTGDFHICGNDQSSTPVHQEKPVLLRLAWFGLSWNSDEVSSVDSSGRGDRPGRGGRGRRKSDDFGHGHKCGVADVLTLLSLMAV